MIEMTVQSLSVASSSYTTFAVGIAGGNKKERQPGKGLPFCHIYLPLLKGKAIYLIADRCCVSGSIGNFKQEPALELFEIIHFGKITSNVLAPFVDQHAINVKYPDADVT
jgi:hypothetical protein